MANSQEERRGRQALMQIVINELVQWAPGHTVIEVGERLDAELIGRGLPPQPANWLESVAHDAISGRTYVVSEEAARDVSLDLPERDAIERSGVPDHPEE
jgi:hypothetical protein